MTVGCLWISNKRCFYQRHLDALDKKFLELVEKNSHLVRNSDDLKLIQSMVSVWFSIICFYAASYWLSIVVLSNENHCKPLQNINIKKKNGFQSVHGVSKCWFLWEWQSNLILSFSAGEEKMDSVAKLSSEDWHLDANCGNFYEHREFFAKIYEIKKVGILVKITMVSASWFNKNHSGTFSRTK